MKAECRKSVEKAYYHVDGDFLIQILKDMDFHIKWLKWISFCIKTVRFSVLINGIPEGFPPFQKGLRQKGIPCLFCSLLLIWTVI